MSQQFQKLASSGAALQYFLIEQNSVAIQLKHETPAFKSPIKNITIPFGNHVPATATSASQLFNNLTL